MKRSLQTAAVRARESQGFTLIQAARKASITPRYLRRIELHGGAPHYLAMRLAHIYNCPTSAFLFDPKVVLQQTTSSHIEQKPTSNRNAPPCKRSATHRDGDAGALEGNHNHSKRANEASSS